MTHLTTAPGPAPRLPRPQLGCQPWCTDHVNGTPDSRAPEPADQLCTHTIESPAFGDFSVTYDTTDGAMIALYNIREDLTLGAFEQLCLLGLAAIAAARSREVAA